MMILKLFKSKCNTQNVELIKLLIWKIKVAMINHIFSNV